MDDEIRYHLAWLMWCYQEGYHNPADRAILTSWMREPDSQLTEHDVELRQHLLGMADEILDLIHRGGV